MPGRGKTTVKDIISNFRVTDFSLNFDDFLMLLLLYFIFSVGETLPYFIVAFGYITEAKAFKC